MSARITAISNPSRVLQAMGAQPWAIQADALQQLSAIAQGGGDLQAAAMASAHRRAQLGEMEIETSGEMTVQDGVARIPLHGPHFPRANMMTAHSGATSLTLFRMQLDQAGEREDVRAVLIEVDSPGGMSTLVDETAGAIRTLSETKPVVGYVVGQGCSGAYWLASACSRLVIAPTAMVGSIGTIFTLSVQEALDQSGRREVDVISSQSPLKRPDPTDADQRAAMVTTLDAISARFIADVARYRGVSAETVARDFGRGWVLTGQAAVDAGMADAVGTLDGTLRELAARVAPTRAVAAGANPSATAPTTPGRPARVETPTEEKTDMPTDTETQTAQPPATTQTPATTPAHQTAAGQTAADQTASGPMAAADVIEACANAKVPALAAGLVRDGATKAQVETRVKQAGLVRDVCASFERPELAEMMVARNLSPDDARAILSGAKAPEAGVTTALPVEATARQPARIDPKGYYDARAKARPAAN